MEGSRFANLPVKVRFRHRLQRAVGWLTGIIWIPLVVATLRFGRGYRFEDMRRLRREFRRIRQASDAPLLVCANHLTLVDSFIIAWGLASPWRYILDFDSLSWNTPERMNFAMTFWSRTAIYLAKCIPIERGSGREEAAAVLSRVRYLLGRGELALVFPEGGRSRTGRVDADSAAWGVGRIVGSLPGCRVLCVYCRGQNQETWGNLPVKGERFEMQLACIEPKSDHRGARASRDLSLQIVTQLTQMEEEYFRDRK